MGNRGQVLIEDEKIYLYTHWGAEDIVSDVSMALSRHQRWDDPEYLARIIFDELSGNEKGEETGFGIGTSQHTDIEKLVIVNCGDKKVIIKDIYGESEEVLSFQDFINKY